MPNGKNSMRPHIGNYENLFVQLGQFSCYFCMLFIQWKHPPGSLPANIIGATIDGATTTKVAPYFGQAVYMDRWFTYLSFSDETYYPINETDRE